MSRNGYNMLRWLWRRLLPDRYEANEQHAKVVVALESLREALKQDDETRIEQLRDMLTKEPPSAE